MPVDLKDSPLKNPMQRPEFMKIHRKNFPQEIIDAYDL